TRAQLASLGTGILLLSVENGICTLAGLIGNAGPSAIFSPVAKLTKGGVKQLQFVVGYFAGAPLADTRVGAANLKISAPHGRTSAVSVVNKDLENGKTACFV